MKSALASLAWLQIQSLLLKQIAAVLGAADGGRAGGHGLAIASRLKQGEAFEDIIARACQRHGVDPALVKGLVKAESGFNPLAVSRAGAKGLMQLMDGTAASLGVTDPFDPAQNIEAGVRLLRQLLDRYQDESLALAAYNAGAGAVDRYGGIPPFAETQVFVPRVLSYRRQLASGALGHADSGAWEA